MPTGKETGNPGQVPRTFPGVDPQTVTAAQHGDALALDQLLDELAPYVRRLCTRIAPAMADDATQEALLAVFRGLPSLRAPEAIITWVRAVSVRTAVRLAPENVPYRRDLRRLEADAGQSPPKADPGPGTPPARPGPR